MSKPTYDPIRSVEGMYKGSLTRLGYFFKDPKLYGGATPGILKETAKCYDDALDDCLIQIMDAKWLLEHQLEQSQVRRARQATEMEAASNKRKLEDRTTAAATSLLLSSTLSSSSSSSSSSSPPLPSSSMKTQTLEVEENPAKRSKVQHTPSDTDVTSLERNQHGLANKVAESKHVHTLDEGIMDTPKLEDDSTQKSVAEGLKLDAQKPSQPDVVEGPGTHRVDTPSEQHHSIAPPIESKGEMMQDHQPDPMVYDEEMNFESMFGEASAGKDESNSLSFDLGLNVGNLDGNNPFASTTQDGNNLELLPGLESYANDGDDDYGMLPTSAAGDQAGTGPSQNSFDNSGIPVDSNFNDLFADGNLDPDAAFMELDLEGDFFKT